MSTEKLNDVWFKVPEYSVGDNPPCDVKGPKQDKVSEFKPQDAKEPKQ